MLDEAHKIADGTENIAEEMYRSIFENAVEGIFQSTPQGQLVIANSALAKIFGYSTPEDIIDSITHLGDQLYADREEYDHFIEQLRENGTVTGIEALMFQKDGTEIWIRLNAVAINDDNGNLLHINGILEDVTEHKRIKEILQGKEAAERANKAKSEFLANMSHEIRTPMNAILGFCDILSEENLAEQQLKFVRIIHGAGKNLLVIINDILDLAKIESGKFNVEIVEYPMISLLEAVESLMLPKATEKGIDFRLRQGSHLPKIIHTDPLRLQQCLINLIGNAIKFTSTGGVSLTVSYERETSQLSFDVEDTGIGIPPEKLEAIFQPFAQAEESTARKYGGTGLGLAITKQLVELLGGRLEVKSTSGKGTVFTLVLPVVVSGTENAEMKDSILKDIMHSREQGDLESFSGSVLIVEDNVSNQQLFKTVMEKLGLEVTIVDNGLKALDAVAQNHYDIIFMDMQMPVMDGYESTRNMRSQSVLVPIAAITAHAMPGDRSKCLAAGCDDYLPKPIRKNELIRVLKQHLNPVSSKSTE